MFGLYPVGLRFKAFGKKLVKRDQSIEDHWEGDIELEGGKGRSFVDISYGEGNIVSHH